MAGIISLVMEIKCFFFFFYKFSFLEHFQVFVGVHFHSYGEDQ